MENTTLNEIKNLVERFDQNQRFSERSARMPVERLQQLAREGWLNELIYSDGTYFTLTIKAICVVG